ncbi:MAG: hypothetical protein AAFQ80_00225 [Cyanobacteria bacterium J06621_8]
MKTFTIATLSALTFSSMSVVVPSNQSAVASTITQNIVEISPRNLVKAAYQGRFINQGIPSNSAFLFAIRGDRIKAEDLVKVGIASGRLTEETLQDSSYLRSVDSSIDRFKRRRL